MTVSAMKSTGAKDSLPSRISYEPFASYDRDGKLVLFLAAEVPTLEWDLCRPQPSSSSSINKFRARTQRAPASQTIASH
jgi:hypothetical protein